MFGYVLPRRDRLSEEAQVRYHAAYCGLCRALKLEYGFAARFLVNYDMTFLYFLLREGDPACPGRCFCPARPWCRKACLPEDGAMRYAADLSVPPHRLLKNALPCSKISLTLTKGCFSHEGFRASL